nr:hypothetical protein KitaXyl93_78870 [Kitasatospora sp. Xyl93]
MSCLRFEALASPTWQREVWLDPDQFEDLDYTVHVLFDDFCDANNPQPWLGQIASQRGKKSS